MGDIPPSIGDKFWPISRFLGYRPDDFSGPKDAPSTENTSPSGKRSGLVPRTADPDPETQLQTSGFLSIVRRHGWLRKVMTIVLTFLGTFVSVALIATMSRSQPFLRRQSPIVIGSFGAEATLLYAAHTSPLTQPRNVMLGNTISAVIGVALGKGFSQIPDFVIGDNGNTNWAAAALSISISIMVMQALNIVHPPGGATAVLAVTIPAVFHLSWFYVGDIAASSAIMLAWAMLVNNLGDRRYPEFWISPILKEKNQKRNRQDSGEKQ